MSAIATDSKLHRTVYFYQTTIGKKVVMAVTGFALFGYILVHLAANLLVFAGPETINGYAAFLHDRPGMLWAARLILLVAVVLHIVSSVQLWLLQRRARPARYVVKNDVPSAYAARTMMLSGPIIAGFVIVHILHLTTGDIGRFVPGDVYGNVVAGFQNPALSIVYIISVALLGLHLNHGLWSMFQSAGFNHPRYTPVIKRFAAIFSILIAGGFIAIPVAVLARLIQ